MNITLRIWRQANKDAKGKMVEYSLDGVSQDMSFLEMLDMLNEHLTEKGDEPVAFDHDCREGICGQCGVVINGRAHGNGFAKDKAGNPIPTTTCQLHMRSFEDGAVIEIEPWRANAFPVLKDLMVDRGALDSIIQAGGFISNSTGGAQDANCLPVGQDKASKSFDAATCIGCGSCVAACPNGSAMLFTSAKITHLALLPQGQPERVSRVKSMVGRHDELGFGGCTNVGECAEVCPKHIPLASISQLNRDLISSLFKSAGK